MKLDPHFIMLEPVRINKVMEWLSQPEFQILVEALDKKRRLILLQACDLQEKSIADDNNEPFKQSAISKLREAGELEIALRVLGNLNDQTQFIAKIEL